MKASAARTCGIGLLALVLAGGLLWLNWRREASESFLKGRLISAIDEEMASSLPFKKVEAADISIARFELLQKRYFSEYSATVRIRRRPFTTSGLSTSGYLNPEGTVEVRVNGNCQMSEVSELPALPMLKRPRWEVTFVDFGAPQGALHKRDVDAAWENPPANIENLLFDSWFDLRLRSIEHQVVMKQYFALFAVRILRREGRFEEAAATLIDTGFVDGYSKPAWVERQRREKELVAARSVE